MRRMRILFKNDRVQTNKRSEVPPGLNQTSEGAELPLQEQQELWLIGNKPGRELVSFRVCYYGNWLRVTLNLLSETENPSFPETTIKELRVFVEAVF